jgi:hypothetical protein
MVRIDRGVATPTVGYVLCALFALSVSACGDGGGSSSALPTAQADTGATTTTTPPTISGTPASTVVAGNKYSFQPSAADTNGDALMFSVHNLPAWATFDQSTGLLSGTPAAADVGTTAPITISVADGSQVASLAPFTIQVTAASSPPAPPSDPPTITGTPATKVQAGAHYAFQPAVTDPSGGVLTFSISGKPAWASFNTASGLLSGTPATADVGMDSAIAISVSDGQHSAALAAFSIQVTAIPPAPPANTPPKITGIPPATVQAGSAYSFSPAASDADGNKLTFSIMNKPVWASFSTSTGQLSGTPAVANIGTYTSITISVSDGTTSVALPAFSVQVTAPVANPPTIAGTPGTNAQVGKAYSFTPTASSPSGKVLSFSVQNKPSWASFSIATGQLSGTPGSSDVGTDSNIVISVSDGTLKAALTGFSIAVAAAPPVTGSAKLTWVPPTRNTDGTTVTNLSGYVISYWLNTSSPQTVTISNPATTTYTIQGLTPGTWYFGVASTATDGTRSALSQTVSKSIQ